jgi:hypothetical protein
LPGLNKLSGVAPGTQLRTVKQVAAVMKVSTWMVYAMIERGELPHVRVSNAIQVVVTTDPK